jgi:hypothetical protein
VGSITRYCLSNCCCPTSLALQVGDQLFAEYKFQTGGSKYSHMKSSGFEMGDFLRGVESEDGQELKTFVRVHETTGQTYTEYTLVRAPLR